MKLESEPVILRSTVVNKSDSKPFECNDYALDASVPKPDNEIVKENQKGNEIVKENQKGVLCDPNANERDADPLPFERDDENGFWNTPELGCFMNLDDVTNDHRNEVKNSVSPCAISSGKLELIEKDGEMCTDKSVTECELPELIVCCKESTYHVVKDICVDEGVLSLDKNLVESGKVEHDSFPTFLPPDTDKNVNPTKETVNKELPLPEGQEALAKNDCVKDAAKFCSLKDLMQAEEGNFDARSKITGDISEEKIVPEDSLLVPELRDEKSIPESSKFNGMEVAQGSIQIPGKEAVLVGSALVPVAEESNNGSFINEMSYDSKVESGSITFDFGSSTSTVSGGEVSPHNDGSEPLVESQNTPRPEDGSDSLPFSGQLQSGVGDSRFSVTGPSSALISYSGQIPHSGNISLRSDSSTTSTRSFAFPILQSEWNSSPVRMAKAEQRHFRKHRSWRQGLLCCRF